MDELIVLHERALVMFNDCLSLRTSNSWGALAGLADAFVEMALIEDEMIELGRS